MLSECIISVLILLTYLVSVHKVFMRKIDKNYSDLHLYTKETETISLCMIELY